MVFIKRILASLINILLLILIVLIIYPIFKHFEIELDNKIFYLISYTIAYFLPILLFRSTVGLKILKVEINSTPKLLLKYFIYYLIISNFLGEYCSILSELFNLQELSLTIISIEVTLLLIHLMMFVLSGGKYNLLDFILNITHASKYFQRTNEKRLIIWLSFCYLVFFMVFLADRSNIIDYIKSLTSPNSKYDISNYYPAEIFENYGIIRAEKFEESNKILISYDSLSIAQDKILVKKTIYVTINKGVNEYILRRKELCNNLIYYSSINDYLGKIYEDVDQTKIVLIYILRNTFLSGLSSTYLYYYDNKDPNGQVYGGVNLDSLIKSYNSYPETYMKTISNIINVDVEKLNERISKDGHIAFSDYEKSIIENAPNSKFPFPYIIKSLPFDSIKPSAGKLYAFPNRTVAAEMLENSTTSTARTIEAINLRNKLYYNYFYKPTR